MTQSLESRPEFSGSITIKNPNFNEITRILKAQRDFDHRIISADTVNNQTGKIIKITQRVGQINLVELSSSSIKTITVSEPS